MSEHWQLIIWGIVLFIWLCAGAALTKKVILSKKKGCSTFFIMSIISIGIGAIMTETITIEEITNEHKKIVSAIPFIVYIVSMIGSYCVGLASKCSNCGKPFALELVNTELLKMGEMFYRKDNNGKRVLMQRNLYMEHYRCEFCGSEFEKKVTKNETVD